VSLGPIELLVLALLVSLVILPVWAIADAARATDSQWAAIGQSRMVWLILLVVLTLAAFPLGIVLSAVYLVTVRPKLATARPATG
jgi:hypothetical protein